ncbi:MAG: acyl-CoA thioesterase [Syntrophobacteraceae bacterium]
MESHFRFFAPVQVLYAEIEQGHVFFGHYFTYFDVGLIEYLRAVGYNYNDFLGEGVDFFYVQANCQYKGRAFFDETLRVSGKPSPISKT